ncbi:CoA activase [candidate division WOR-3 bacterium]|nr:CoA activase [candidate division WOR-3 bacterium]
MEKERLYIGIDIGSVSINIAVLNENKQVSKDWYIRIKGEPLKETYDVLKLVNKTYPILPVGRQESRMAGMATTGIGGKLLSKILNIPFVNEILAQTLATSELYPDVRSIIEIGGEDSKLILIEYDKRLGIHVMKDFAMNTICAAGTGSFLDQQASRLGLSIDDFGKLALKSNSPPRIAGRCSVFANTDMIHLQQEATPDYDIVAGLCFALARNFKSIIAKGKHIRPPVAFQGGVSANSGMVRAFKAILGLKDDELIIPTYFASMGAIGCTLTQMQNANCNPPEAEQIDIERIPEFLNCRKEESDHLKPLVLTSKSQPSLPASQYGRDYLALPTSKLPVWLGIDVGSISTNIVLIDANKCLVAHRYLWTSGRPIDAVRNGFKEIGKEVRNHVEVKGVGTTGSGRYMIGDLVGADTVKNEITSQARASLEIDSSVDTIFEIGGQDSKYISLQNGAIRDFEMNKVCAAGTGSFLEEQAERLNLNIREEFGKCALSSKSPIRLGDRCTVFMGSDLTAWQQKGAKREDLVAGLSYSIVENYLSKVVGNKRIGDNIFFQGAVAKNKGVVAAFENVLEKPITIPPHPDIIGAIGVAILAMEYMSQKLEVGSGKSKFKGFDLCKKKYNIESFECNGCPNACEIKRVVVEGESLLYYGSRCDKYGEKLSARRFPARRIAGGALAGGKIESASGGEKLKVDLFKEREELLLKTLNSQPSALNSQPSIGIPRALIFQEYLPFWTTFFQELKCKVVLSDSTNRKIIHEGVESVVSEHCFPIKACHGHILNLIEKGVDYIFLPSMISMQKENKELEESYACPFIQGVPYVIKAALNPESKGIKLLTPILYLKRGKKHLAQVLIRQLTDNRLGKSKMEVIRAIDKADRAQRDFYESIKARGKAILGTFKEPVIVLVGRPYNTCDTGLNLNIPKILGDLGVLTIPMDFLPLEEVDIGKDWTNMYWRYGQRILSALRIIKQHSNLYPLYITNFGCGADSFILRYFSKEIGKKPHLIIEVDEHSAPAGVITRCEAFLDSLKNVKRVVEPTVPIFKKYRTEYDNRTLFIPFMGYHSYILAAAFRHCGIDTKVMPITDNRSLELGKRYTTGKECFPCILTTGDMIKILSNPSIDHNRVAFFMPESCGPCRFGQYNRLQRLILSEVGYDDVPIVSPNQAKDFYKTLRKYGKDFDKRAWAGVCAVDILTKLKLHTRPHEVNIGDTDRAYFKSLDLICTIVEGNGDISEPMRAIKEEFKSIPVHREPKPIIGITGEIYVRLHHFANNDIIRTIEELGGEVWLSPTTEWFFYINFRRKEDSILDKNYRELIMHWITGKYQHWVEHRIQKGFKDCIFNFDEPSTEKIFQYTNPYLHQTVEGEAPLTVGKCIDFIKKGADSIITVMPFTCMPGTNVTAVMSKIREEYDIPYLNMSYDGLEQSTASIRLEAFIHQAKQHMKRKKNHKLHK